MAGGPQDQLIRAFIAVDPGPGSLPGLEAAIRRLKSGPQGDTVRWVHPGNLHVTLRFLGNIEQNKVEPLRRQIAETVAQIPPFGIAPGQVVPFPSPRRPRVVALELRPVEALAALAEAVERGVRAAGLPGENRPFRAHLTLGRLRRNAPRRPERLLQEIDHLNREGSGPSAADPVDRVVLYRSDLKPQGPVYTVLWDLPLEVR